MIELTKEQLLSAIKKLDENEWQWLEEERKKHVNIMCYRIFTRDDPLWKGVGIGRSKSDYIARDHDKYIYQKDW